MSRGQHRIVCRYFSSSGNCLNGDRCRFLHVHRPKTYGRHHHEPLSQAQLPSISMAKGLEQPGHFQGASNSYVQQTNMVVEQHNMAVDPRHSQGHPLPGVLPSERSFHPVPIRPPTHYHHQPTTSCSSPRPPRPLAPSMPSLSVGTRMAPPTLSPEEMMRKLRQELLQRQAECESSSGVEYVGPSELESYHSICQLESQTTSQSFVYDNTVYRAVSHKDNEFYCLRRFHNFPLTSSRSVQEAEKWKKLPRNSNIAPLVEMFTTKAFGDNSLVFVHEFVPGAKTLFSRYLQCPWTGFVQESDDVIWPLAVQLISVVAFIHSHDMAVRCLHPSKVLLVGENSPRVMITCGGVMDVLAYDHLSDVSSSLSSQQQEDMNALGQILLCVALRSSSAASPDTLPQSMELLANSSPELQHVFQYLLDAGSMGANHRMADLLPIISSRALLCLEHALGHRALLEAELGKELQNGRLFRMLAKLGFINDRPEFLSDPQWSETGDRYMLKLLRDYLFHQVDPSGSPWVDLAHVIQSLNKLDVGSNEQICLASSDEQSIMIISFSDLKTCLDSAFQELLQEHESSSLYS